MPTVKAKKKAEPKKAKAAKAKPAPKAKAKPKKAVKAKAVPKAAKAKKVVKTKAHADVKSTPKAKAKHAKPKHIKHGMTEAQKSELLYMIEQVVELRRAKPGGLRSFFMIDRILDVYNQRYKHPNEKFDAIVAYGVEKHDGVKGSDVFVFVDGRQQDETSLFELLSDINHDNLKFAEAKEKLNKIYEESQSQK